MCRPVRVSVEHLQELPCRSIVRDWVWNRPKTIYPVVAVLVGCEVCPKVELWLFGVLLLVQAICRALPDIYFDPRNRLVRGSVPDNTVHIYHLAIIRLLQNDAGIVLCWWRIVPEERPEDGTLGRLV